MRTAKLRRTTGETDVAVVLDLDGTGKSDLHRLRFSGPYAHPVCPPRPL